MLTGTIRENVLYGTKNCTEKELEAALKAAYAYDFVMSLEDGLDTEVGEGGIKLSGGQKQRIAIAHRLSTITHADHIFIFENGSVSGYGTHASLLKEHTYYKQLWQTMDVQTI